MLILQISKFNKNGIFYFLSFNEYRKKLKINFNIFNLIFKIFIFKIYKNNKDIMESKIEDYE